MGQEGQAGTEKTVVSAKGFTSGRWGQQGGRGAGAGSDFDFPKEGDAAPEVGAEEAAMTFGTSTEHWLLESREATVVIQAKRVGPLSPILPHNGSHGGASRASLDVI